MKLVSLLVGKPKELDYRGRPVATAINKEAVQGEVNLYSEQLAGDGQADRVNHGGPDKAVCVYCAEHYPHWERELGAELAYGAFGENFTVTGLTEEKVCIGDIFEIGSALVQVSQPRQPCFKLGLKHGVDELPVLVQESGYTGYYFRVLKEGVVAAGAEIRLVERHSAAVTVDFANEIKYKDKHNYDALRRLLDIPELSASWRDGFTKRLKDAAT
ncbi:MOSC domain-containing protein [Paenibacillus thalictri]|uniref:MOSC domain-containing protein n=1 Tax=Paenibacillus thalictri TaxID=2527873 RepID=A0A4V2J2Y3_9BACL|nr:MOSC domain-containing protein [Paenibacillus thalictri]TBL67910.1 MOSC domain-containing protein [Paenibacillus thalictri]